MKTVPASTAKRRRFSAELGGVYGENGQAGLTNVAA
jgi:hypothetical protein